MICKYPYCTNVVTPSNRPHITLRKVYCSKKCRNKFFKIGYKESKVTAYARHKRWRKANPDRARENFSKWAKSEKGQILRNISIAKWKGSDSLLFYKNRHKLCVVDKSPCAKCNAPYKRGFVCDHIIPRRLGGTHDISNLQILCPPCNSAKTAIDIHNISKYKNNS